MNVAVWEAIKTQALLIHLHKCVRFGESWVMELECVWSQPKPACSAFLEGSTYELKQPGFVLLFPLFFFSVSRSLEGLSVDNPQLRQGHPHALLNVSLQIVT